MVHFENFIIADDDTGAAFGEALMERARAGVTVRVLYDWLGTSWRALPRSGTGSARPAWRFGCSIRRGSTDPFFIRRNHRKVITIDGTRGFVAGLCVSKSWRDTMVPSHGAIRVLRSKAPWWRISTLPLRIAGVGRARRSTAGELLDPLSHSAGRRCRRPG